MPRVVFVSLSREFSRGTNVRVPRLVQEVTMVTDQNAFTRLLKSLSVIILEDFMSVRELVLNL